MRSRIKRKRLYEFEKEVREISRLIVGTDADFLNLLVRPKILALVRHHKRKVDYSLVKKSAAELHCKLLNKIHSKKTTHVQSRN